MVKLSSDESVAYVTDGGGGFRAIDISNSSNPTLLDSFGIGYAIGLSLSSDNTKAFIGDYYSDGLIIINTNNPSSLSK